jgi:uncharacterized protein (DUF2141 family)
MKKKMQNFLKIMLLTGTMTALLSFTTKSSENASLNVTVSGIQNSEGTIHVLLFNNATGYPANPKKAYKHSKVNAVKGNVDLQIANIPTGTYSIVSFHDKNNNGQFDKSWFGSPKEDYGFSNIPNEFCGTPSFQQTSFSVNEKNNSVSIKLMKN